MDKKSKSKRAIKEEKVKTLAEKIAKAKTLAFVDFRGLTANQVAELRAKIKAAGGQFLVEKNTLISRALRLSTIDYRLSTIAGPTAAILSYDDEVSAIKEIAQIAKTLGVPTFKFGFLDSEILDAEALENLAKIPSRDDLHATLVGSLTSPIYGFVSVLAANIRNLVSVLDQAAKAG
ncbi:50S ribosomal protein L10 [Candidatus Curtissbacteria bacterium RIFCSPLOWO2_01_FULL_41_18]|uniref:Large ribosomal subunit protein uL10 n=2 Tax=Candidatus Curtissiibacteriota TaxID=1752717 RepID=A0A1F5FZ26_9BACT|nr:MAG: 50S ribosomal protein L10 [Candidatus Curtissbacteria bacterium RIFCSPHIGHO2_01_FULL_41_13]OGE04114.1 MAG: 50S ribosomal protein L10 [Candidatus Curtissbacteria bacterium RIFCSPLOWO2_01_FULL_41_18]